ncbi:aminotransferase class I/II-fold pyridoxal phosphate-dependent enzyme [Flavivirga algicola]|uniref:Aminotransferase class I/II-fold pyridoxal phosphate-dependent enzyme n=1 Tax=Flavivirga algicola TaxID=2729136 RepID=A0ABX1RV51_9FLAO|nr:aminotransferase class I/II-fold pyridoxal phosphate-dependent enzyme [Flavivirga algicola]NMH87422.1 aminotransferase class I/II-fold pyridoxal phosphate-dependent enzyme [Flavivirga algicola]
MFPKNLQQKLEKRKANNALRHLAKQNNLVDFSSNDYLGFSKSETIFNNSHEFLIEHNMTHNGTTGSRLLSGNHPFFNSVESLLSDFHNSESALIFNSGYDANIGIFSSIPQRGDIILYDEYIHASIRDGIKLSNAKAYKFKHNNLKNLKDLLERSREASQETNIYVVTESVFSMDGDSPDLKGMVGLCKKENTFLIIDEAHAIGVFGERGMGMVQDSNLENDVFARIVTFGKAIGAHGAVILGSKLLKQFLVNFSRSFIYTTALPPHALATVYSAYHELTLTKHREQLHENITHFKSEVIKNNLQDYFTESYSAIHCCIISGNETVKRIAKKFQEHGFNIKPILSPTVPKDQERLRFCLHSYNSKAEISQVLNLLTTFV